MADVLFTFENPADARRAADRLVDEGLRRDDVSVHVHESAPHSPLATEVDELVTGGMVRNFQGLLENLFDWGSSDHDIGEYADVMDRGGAVLAVVARNAEQRDIVERVMQTMGASRRTNWSSELAR